MCRVKMRRMLEHGSREYLWDILHSMAFRHLLKLSIDVNGSCLSAYQVLLEAATLSVDCCNIQLHRAIPQEERPARKLVDAHTPWSSLLLFLGVCDMRQAQDRARHHDGHHAMMVCCLAASRHCSTSMALAFMAQQPKFYAFAALNLLRSPCAQSIVRR